MQTLWFAEIFSIAGWLAIAFAKVYLLLLSLLQYCCMSSIYEKNFTSNVYLVELYGHCLICTQYD